ncbi:hypothetical protein D915_009284 [Fasciola hepatica]|uniref:Uncharacterized protein n=1 Tax=Fasciola hepatica TaxID=6192 RepID=A0A4E0RWX1_FASHE|nr:hypothetical protein D915_009284 [Fasciola hepatica]
MNTSASFEVAFDNERDGTAHQFRSPLNLSQSRSFVESDLSSRLESAEKRRRNVLTETRLRNEQHIQNAKAICEKGKEKILNRSTEILGSLEEDLATKALRRQQHLEQRVSCAKQQVTKVEQASEVRAQSEALLRETLLKQIEQDMSNKENRRRSIIENIKQKSQKTAVKVDRARSRRSVDGNGIDL